VDFSIEEAVMEAEKYIANLAALRLKPAVCVHFQCFYH
jgi:hypothetical protein